MTQITSIASDKARQYILFIAGNQEFCTEVAFVREIRGWAAVTTLPHAPSFVRGVINLRGAVLPIIDLAQRLGFAPSETTARHVIMVVQVSQQIVGLLVDAVFDIITRPDSDIQPTPDVASDTTKSFIKGVLAIDNRMVSLLTLPGVLPEKPGMVV